MSVISLKYLKVRHKYQRRPKRVNICWLCESRVMVERSACLGPALIHILSSICCASFVSFCSRPALLSPSECLSHLTACVFHLNMNWQPDSTPDSRPSVLLAAAGCSWGSTPGSSPNVRLLKGLLKAWTLSKELTGPAHPTDCQGK